MAKGNPNDSRKIASIEFISGSNKITWKQTNEGVVIKTKGEKPCEAAYSFRIQFLNMKNLLLFEKDCQRAN